MAEIQITQATLANIDQLAVLNKYLIEDEQHPNPMNVEQLAKRMSGWLQAEYTGYLAWINDYITAYCLYRDDGEFYYLRQLYVARGFRRQGIATRLLNWMYANVWTEKKVRLGVLAHNKGAIAFYNHYGFRTKALRLEK
jgi:ribosomal protein S18 acetylase RimI-like enzyme